MFAARSSMETDRIALGHPVPEFTIDIYDPENKRFGQLSLAELRAQDRWTILFFYPADFTFV